MENIDHLRIQRQKILVGLEEVYQKLIEFKKSKNSPLVVSEDGTVRHISPFQLNWRHLRNCLARNEPALFAIKRERERTPSLKVTLPEVVEGDMNDLV